MGLLDTAIPSDYGDINSLLAQFQPSQADKDQALKMAKLQFFLGMMGARQGSVFQDVANSGINASNNYQKTIQLEQAQRNQNIQAVTPLIQLAQRQQLGKQISDIMNGAQQPVTSLTGPAQPFQQTGGAAGAMNAGVTGQGNTTALPTSQNIPAYQADPNMRQKLAQVGVLAKVNANLDLSPEFKFMMPDPVRVNQGGGVYNPATGQVMMVPKVGEGSVPVQQGDGSFISQPVPGALPGIQAAAAAQSGGEASGKLPYTFQRVPNGLGGETTMPSDMAMSLLRGQSQSPPGAASAPSAGSTASPASGLTDAAQAAANAPVPRSFGPGTTPSPDVMEYRNKRASELAENMSQYVTEGRGATEANAVLQDIKSQVQSFTPGAMVGAGSKVAEILVGAGVPENSPFVQWFSRGAVGAVQASDKDTLLLQTAMTKSLGSREAAQVFMNLLKANPSSGMTPQGIAKVIDFIQGQNNWKIQRMSDALDWTNSPLNKTGTLEGFDNWYNTNKPPTKFIGHLSGTMNPVDQAARGRGYGVQVGNGVATPNAPQGSPQPAPQPSGKTVVRTGTFNGKRVVQYSDGTVSYQ